VSSKREEIKAGFMILTSLILLSGFIILIGGSPFFEKLDKYHVQVMDAAGLEVGAQVKLGGVRVGRILNIHPPGGAGQPITIEIGIKQGTILYKGTLALITQVGLVGDLYLLLSVEKTRNERIRVGETIPSEEQVQFARIMARVEDLSKSIDGLIRDVDKLFSQKNIKEIETVFENANKMMISASSSLGQIVSALRSATDNLGLALNEIRDVVRDNKGELTLVIQRAREVIEKTGETVEKIREVIEKTGGTLERSGDMIRAFEETAKALESTSKSADKTIQSVDKAVRSIDKSIDLNSQNLNQLLHVLTRTTEDLQDVIREIKAKPWGLIYKEGTRREE
jgi:phospholipid/cholesterol/gamma-HCH transport system substrate-binding protein